MKKLSVIGLLISIIFLSSCNDEEYEYFVYSDNEYNELTSILDLPREYDDFTVLIPNHLFSGQASRRINVGNLPKANMGRVLFYDTRLSSTNTISCASCHKQEFAFADNKALSD